MLNHTIITAEQTSHQDRTSQGGDRGKTKGKGLTERQPYTSDQPQPRHLSIGNPSVQQAQSSPFIHCTNLNRKPTLTVSHQENSEIVLDRHKFQFSLTLQMQKMCWMSQVVETKVCWIIKARTCTGGWSNAMTFYVSIRKTVPFSVL